MGAGEHEGLEVGRVDEGRVHGDGDGRRGAGSGVDGLRAGGGRGPGEESERGEARDLGGSGHGGAVVRRENSGAVGLTITMRWGTGLQLEASALH